MTTADIFFPASATVVVKVMVTVVKVVMLGW